MKFRFSLIFLLIISATLTINGQAKEIKVASFKSKTSYDFNLPNNTSGEFSNELIKIILDKLNYPYNISYYNTIKNIEYNAEKLDEALNECDLALTIVPNDNTKYTYSIPYVLLSYDILTRDTMSFRNIEDLINKSIIVKRGSTSQNKVEAFGLNYFSNIIYVNDVETGIRLLQEGNGEYMISDEIASKGFSKIKTANNISTYSSNLPPLKICFASKNEELISDINNMLGVINSDGTYDALYNKWFSAKTEKPTEWYIYWILCAIGIIIIVLLCSVYILRKLVRKATKQSQESYNKITDLNQSISLLIRNGKIDIFMYDIQEMALYTLQKGSFIKKIVREDELFDKIHPQDRKKYYDEYYKFINGGTEYLSIRVRVLNKQDDRYLYYEYVIKPLKRDYNNKVTRYIYSRKDETNKLEKIQNQKELIQNLNLALRSSKLARWEYNIANNTITIYHKDSTKTTIIKNNIYELIHPSDREIFDNYIQKAIFSNEVDNIILKLKAQDNDIFKTCEISSTIKYDEAHKPIAVLGIIKDISDIELYQQKIFELQYNMQLALEAGEMSAWSYDRLEEMYTILHGPTLNNGKMTKDEYLAFTHPDDRSIMMDAIEKIITKEKERITITFRMNTTGEDWKWYSCSIMAIPTDKEVRYIIGTRKDITQEIEDAKLLQKANKELEKSQERLKLILDKLPIPIYIKDPNQQKHVYINDEAKRLYFTNINNTPFELVIEENAEYCENIDKELLETGNDYISNEVLHFKSGRVMNTYVKKIIVEISGKKMILAVRTDLTEQLKYQLTSKILSKALPLLKAYTWSFTTRDDILNFGETFIQNQRKYSELNSVEKFISIIHPDDRKTCEEIIKTYLKLGTGEYTFRYRMDLLEKGVYEWWESKSVVETIHDNIGTYILVYGVEININDKVMIEAECEA